MQGLIIYLTSRRMQPTDHTSIGRPISTPRRTCVPVECEFTQNLTIENFLLPPALCTTNSERQIFHNMAQAMETISLYSSYWYDFLYFRWSVVKSIAEVDNLNRIFSWRICT